MKIKKKIVLGGFILFLIVGIVYVRGDTQNSAQTQLPSWVPEGYTIEEMRYMTNIADGAPESIYDIYSVDTRTPGEYKFTRNTSEGEGWLVLDSETMEVLEISSDIMWMDKLLFDIKKEADCQTEECIEDYVKNMNPLITEPILN